MTKTELSEILHEFCENVSDSITDMEQQNVYPRVVYWSYMWDYITGSGTAHEDVRTYQVSIWGKVPPEHNPVVAGIRGALASLGYYPTIQHEYVRDDAAFHSYFSLEVIEG